jgi:hypothetical protein
MSVWSQDTFARGVVAVLFAGMLLVAAKVGAHAANGSPVDGVAYDVATFGMADEGSQIDELDPTDDGSIIIECVGVAVPGPRKANELTSHLFMRTVALPQFPLGPSTCSPKEHKRA